MTQGRKTKDLVGQTFGRWLVLSLTGRASKSKTAESIWRCQCTCGKVRERVRCSGLVRGTSTSCGCVRIEGIKKRFTKIKTDE